MSRRPEASAWENTWAVYSIADMVVAGWAVALRNVPHLPAVYATVGAKINVKMLGEPGVDDMLEGVPAVVSSVRRQG